jgi:SAM-dependent methyltransferase
VEPDYDRHADVYDEWSTADNPYRAIESFTFMEVIGPVRGLVILDLGCGEGRTCRRFIARGARSVLGADISPEMIRRASEKNTARDGSPTHPRLRYRVLDARDETFVLAQPVDLVSAMYLLHYASTETELEKMCRLIARSLRPGGRFVTYGVNPDYDHSRHEPRLEQQFGIDSRLVEGNRCELAIGDMRVDFWQWSRQTHEACLRRAGLDDIQWHPLDVHPGGRDLRASVQWYLDNPPCTVLSARKPE